MALESGGAVGGVGGTGGQAARSPAPRTVVTPAEEPGGRARGVEFQRTAPERAIMVLIEQGVRRRVGGGRVAVSAASLPTVAAEPSFVADRIAAGLLGVIARSGPDLDAVMTRILDGFADAVDEALEIVTELGELDEAGNADAVALVFGVMRILREVCEDQPPPADASVSSVGSSSGGSSESRSSR